MIRFAFLACCVVTASASTVAAQTRVAIDLSIEDFDRLHTDLSRRGWSLVDLNGYAAGGRDRFAAVWGRRRGVRQAVTVSLTADEFYRTDDEHRRYGFQPAQVSGYRVRGRDFYAGVWEQGFGRDRRVEVGRTFEAVQFLFERYVDEGYRMADLSVAAIGGRDLYSAVWERGPLAGQIARNRMTRREYFNLCDQLDDRGYGLVSVSGCFLNGQDLYAAIWEPNGPPQRARYPLSAAEFARVNESYAAEGFTPTAVSVLADRGGDFFTAVWDRVGPEPRRRPRFQIEFR